MGISEHPLQAAPGQDAGQQTIQQDLDAPANSASHSRQNFVYCLGQRGEVPEQSEEVLLTLRHANEQFCQFLGSVRDYGIFLTDRAGRIAVWNAGAEHITGWAEAEVLGKHASLIFTPEDKELSEPQKELATAEAQGRAEDKRWHLKKDGSCFWGSGVMTALKDEAGNLRGFCKILRDLTERHQREEERKAAAEKDRRIAEALQRAMLVPVKEDAFPGVAVATLHEAALEEAQVGGDFFDAFLLGDNLLALAVGNASGKGLPAAARTTQVKDVLRAFLRSFEDADAPRAMARLNDYICDSKRLDASDGEGFVCLSLVLLDTATGEATFTVAGAEPPLVLMAGGEVEMIEAPGLPLGVLPQQEYPGTTFHLEPGDTVLLVKDGSTEARLGGAFLSFEGMIELAKQAVAAGSVPEAAQKVLDGAKAFAGGHLHDDACLLLARRR